MLGAPGWVLSSAVAASATITMGAASMLWFERGEKPSQAAIQRLMGEVTGHLRDQLTRGGKDKPSQKELQERLQAALRDLPEQRLDEGPEL